MEKEYIELFNKQHNELFKKAVQNQLKTGALCIAIILVTLAGIATGIFCAIEFYTPLILTVSLIGTICGGITGLAAAVLGGVWHDITSYHLYNKIQWLNQELTAEFKVRMAQKTLGGN